MHRAKKRIAWAAVALSTLAILVATLRPDGTALPSGWSFAVGSGDAAFAQVLQNLLLFIPLGMALAWTGVRPLRAIAIGAGLSFTVEFIQQWLPGRDPSVGDILCNTISTAIGLGLVRSTPHWLTVAPRRAAWQALATALAAATVWLSTGALLRPVLPPPPYRDVWTPNFNYWGQYRGKVLSATLGPLPLSQGPLVRVTAIAARRPPGRRSPLLAILDARQRPVLLIIVDRTDLGVRYATRAGELRLEQPDLRWRHALAPPQIAPGDTFTVQTWRGERGSCLAVNSERRCGLGYSIGDGWKLIFYPEHFPGWAMTLLNALWVGGLLLGVGYWGGRAGKQSVRQLAATAGSALGVVILGLLVVPSLTGLNATPIVEWVGGLGGIAGGYLASGRFRVLKDRLGYYTRP